LVSSELAVVSSSCSFYKMITPNNSLLTIQCRLVKKKGQKSFDILDKNS